ncbi:DNA repair protein rad50 [Basidiobolus ranarum]|uniref:DNA repair protein rad50 n=1 Tax=Basidiobolus ranarum TaxID=34480 RepID=A0ABR2WAN3_9FUNG
MSSIEKLLIRGIRSFDPQGTNVIEFYTPLTIIVGHNGSGKTTIIECLKYATTGDLPPNSKGGAFIHDPKVAHETEVRAQIKLKFKNVNQRQMVCTRSIQLTQKKTSVMQKTLESLLLAKDPVTGEQVSISSRCAELDNDLPLHLGVSKAILDNVIFCHQEESNWPLSEPGVLKKKFDEIFAATRYTKALNNIKDLRKEQAIEIRLDTQSRDSLKANTEKAEKVRAFLNDISENIESTGKQTSILDVQLKEVTERISHLVETNSESERLDIKISQLTYKKKTLEEKCDDLLNEFTEFTESDEELRELMEEHERKLSNGEQDQKNFEYKIGEALSAIEQFNTDRNKCGEARGRLQGEYDENQKRKVEIDQELSHIKTKLSSNGIQVPQDQEEFYNEFEIFFKNQLENAEKTRQEYRDREREVNLELASIEGRISTCDEGKQKLQGQLDKLQIKIEEKKAELGKFDVSESDSQRLTLKLKREESALDDLKFEIQAKDSSAKIAKSKRECQEIEKNIWNINKEITTLNSQSSTRTKLALLQSDRDSSEKTLNNLIKSNEAEFVSSIGYLPAADKIKNEMQAYKQNKDNSLRGIEKRLEIANKELSSADTRLSISKESLNRKKKELEEKQQRIEAVCGNTEFPLMLQEIENAVSEQMENLVQLRSASQLYTVFINKAKQQHSCPLCTRDLPDEEEMRFIRRLESKISKTPAEIESAEDELSKFEIKRDKLRTLSSAWDAVVELRQIEIPDLEEEIENLEKEQETAESNTDNIMMELAAVKAEYESALNLCQKADDIARIYEKIKAINNELKEQERQLRHSGSTKTIEEYQNELEPLEIRLRSLRREIDRLEEEKSSKEITRYECEDRIREMTKELNSFQSAFQDREALQKSIKDLEQESQYSQDQIIKYNDEITQLTPKLKEIEDIRSQIQKEGDEHIEEVQREANAVEQAFNRIKALERKIQQYAKDNKEQQLRECAERIQHLDNMTRDKEEIVEQLRQEIDLIKTQLHQMNELKRNIDGNIRYRQTRREIHDIENNLSMLYVERKKYDDDSYAAQLHKLEEKQSRLQTKTYGLRGELKQLEDQRNRLIQELDTDYKDVEGQYRMQVIKLKTSEMANADLEKYAKALDSAIMKYHSLKMEEINKIIRELWMNTYQGNDIDTIEIRSDCENTKGNRSYNYRVVMIKGETELDMRGRCSAGQKVLTSLIVRLALAETFCLNCGILALDEPTTNLDRANIESLAESLANIIKIRRQQSNFQLIVITHDEDFMQLLGKSEFADYYWRVYKDIDQHSAIERQSIAMQ